MQEINTTKSATLSQLLQQAANKYETENFYAEDPSQFLHYFDDEKDTELACFFVAMMSFGRRDQFIPKIKILLEKAKAQSGFCKYIKSGLYEKDLQELARNFSMNNMKGKFYRFYSYNDIMDLFNKFRSILLSNENEEMSFGNYFKEKWLANPETDLGELIAQEFSDCSMVPSTKNSCKKRIYMYLRWMVRQNSKVDLGLWNWYPQSKLIIPLDTHVIQQAEKLGLIKENSPANIKTARQLTEKLSEFFPGDPVRADFALFSLDLK